MHETLHSTPPAARFDLYQQIGEALVSCAPTGWAKIAVEVRMRQNHLLVEAHCYDDSPAAEPRALDVPAEVVLWFGSMREVMPMAGHSLWHGARFTLFANGHFDCMFDYEPDAAPASARVAQASPLSLDEVDALMLDLASANVAVMPPAGTVH